MKERKEYSPRPEEEKQVARKACAFALVAFSAQWEGEWLPGWLRDRNVELTPEQLSFAKNLREVFPEPEEVLPRTEFNSARLGYRNFSDIPIGRIIPELLEDKHRRFEDPEYKSATELFQQDPTGVSFLQNLLGQKEEATAREVLSLELRVDEAKAKIAEILTRAKEIPDEIETPKPLDDQDINDKLLQAFQEIFGGKQTRRQEFIERSRKELHDRIAIEFDDKNKIFYTNALVLWGAIMAFERWQTAVNVYMNRWGNASK